MCVRGEGEGEVTHDCVGSVLDLHEWGPKAEDSVYPVLSELCIATDLYPWL